MARWSPLAGIVFAVVFVATGIVVQDAPAAGATDAEIRSYFADAGNQWKLDLSTLALTIGALFLLWFVAALAARLRGVGDGSLLRGVVLVSGAAATAVMLAGAALGAVVADTSNDTARFVLDPNTERLLSDVAYTLTFETAFPLLAPLVVAFSLAALRAGLVPRWLAWAGLAAAVACLLAFVGGSAVALVWLVAVSVALVRSGPRSEPAAPPAEAPA